MKGYQKGCDDSSNGIRFKSSWYLILFNKLTTPLKIGLIEDNRWKKIQAPYWIINK